VQLDHSGGAFNNAGIGVTGLSPFAFRASSSEAALKGKKIEASVIEAAAALADKEAPDAMSDIHASGDYRRNLARVLTGRAIRKAAGLS
jgi:aerobic carbon-monoxide dehydrogenase medium subunit